MSVKSKELYMCKIDYDYHLEHDAVGTKVYPSLEALAENHDMYEECGYVKVRVELVEVMDEGKI